MDYDSLKNLYSWLKASTLSEWLWSIVYELNGNILKCLMYHNTNEMAHFVLMHTFKNNFLHRSTTIFSKLHVLTAEGNKSLEFPCSGQLTSSKLCARAQGS